MDSSTKALLATSSHGKTERTLWKDGSTSRENLIDGQQRITALTAATEGQMVVTKNERAYHIAFHPSKRNSKSSLLSSKKTLRITDISEALSQTSYDLITAYFEENPELDKDKEVFKNLTRLFKNSPKANWPN